MCLLFCNLFVCVGNNLYIDVIICDVFSLQWKADRNLIYLDVDKCLFMLM